MGYQKTAVLRKLTKHVVSLMNAYDLIDDGKARELNAAFEANKQGWMAFLDAWCSTSRSISQESGEPDPSSVFRSMLEQLARHFPVAVCEIGLIQQELAGTREEMLRGHLKWMLDTLPEEWSDCKQWKVKLDQ